MKRRAVVIGLGQFGKKVARALARRGFSVLAIDQDMKAVEEIAPDVDRALALDSVDENALVDLKLEELECAVCALGSDSLEASILTTALLRQFGVRRIVSRSMSALHARILLKVGAHETVNPEEEMGERLAFRLSFPGLLEQIPLADDVSLIEIPCPETFHGRTLRELGVRQRYGLTVVAIRRVGKDRRPRLLANPRPGAPLQSGDVLVVIGSPESAQLVAQDTGEAPDEGGESR